MKHAPCGFVRYASFTFDLLRRNAAPGRSHQVDRMEPRFQRRARFMEDCSGRWVDVMPAIVARVGRTLCVPVVLGDPVALFALNAVRVKVIPKPL
jgi:hypothetical protein